MLKIGITRPSFFYSYIIQEMANNANVKLALQNNVVKRLLNENNRLQKENINLYWELAAYQEYGKSIAKRNGENKKGQNLKKKLNNKQYNTK